jgi:site-specific DNA recombinase
MVQVGRDYLGCGNRTNKDTCDQARLVRRGRIEAVVFEGLKTRLLNPELVRVFCEEFVAEVNRLRRERERLADTRTAEHKRLDRQISNIVEAIKAGLASPALSAELRSLETARAEFDGPAAATTPLYPVLLHPSLGSIFSDKIARLQESLAEPDLRVEAADILRSLVEGIVVMPDATGKGVTVRLEGDLAEMLAFAASGQQNARQGLPGGRSTKLVAGAGFEPAAFRL